MTVDKISEWEKGIDLWMVIAVQFLQMLWHKGVIVCVIEMTFVPLIALCWFRVAMMCRRWWDKKWKVIWKKSPKPAQRQIIIRNGMRAWVAIWGILQIYGFIEWHWLSITIPMHLLILLDLTETLRKKLSKIINYLF